METEERTDADSPITPAPIVQVTPGQVIGDRYRVEEPLGTGGMGVVCRATHLGLMTPVAIKLIRSDFSEDSEFVRRFLNEARRAATLKSERITHVHDVGQLDSGEPFLVMELLDGVELAQYLKQHGPLDPADAVNVALQIAEGLAEAHACGIVHRDIKPGNTFLVRRADGRYSVKILDFGISKQVEDAPNTLTDSGQSLGSPWYMSPEQMLDASTVDHRSDIWSLGIVLFELLTGVRPFDGATVPEVCAKVLTGPAPSVRDYRPEIDDELEAIVNRCLAKDVSDRYPDIATLGDDLHHYALARAAAMLRANVEPTAFFEGVVTGDEGSIAPMATLASPTFARRKRRAHGLAALGIAATIVLAGLAFGHRSLEAARKKTARLGSTVVAASHADAPAANTGLPAATASEPPPPPPNPTTIEPPPAFPAAAAAPSAVTTAPPAGPPATTAGVATTTAAPAVTAPPPAAPPATTATPAATATAPPAPARRAYRERTLSPDEIAARKERYVQWLAAEGLRRIDEVDRAPAKQEEKP